MTQYIQRWEFALILGSRGQTWDISQSGDLNNTTNILYMYMYFKLTIISTTENQENVHNVLFLIIYTM
jgi:hypothetical protein